MRFTADGNPTTGYTWNLVEDPNGAFTVVKTYKSAPRQPHEEYYTGMGGTFYFTVTGSTNGPAEGEFLVWHGREWEGIENSY